jgi:hypothetical protein
MRTKLLSGNLNGRHHAEDLGVDKRLSHIRDIGWDDDWNRLAQDGVQ